VMPGLINLDFADVRSVMSEMGKAMMGTGEAEGEHRAIEAAERAIANPLLDDISMKGARGVLINITGGPDLTLFEVDEAANRIREEVDPEANIIVGSTLDANMDGRMRVSVVATGIDAAAQLEQKPQATPALRLVTPPQAKPVNFGAPMVRPAAAMPAQPAVAMPSPVIAGATALAMPEPMVAAQPAAMMDLPAPGMLPAAMQAPLAEPAAEPAMAVAAAPVFEPQPSARPFAAEVAAEAAPAHFAPPPAQPMPGRMVAAEIRQPDPFAEADMVNRPAEPRKKLGLFERITGATRGRPEGEPAMPARHVEPQFARQPAQTHTAAPVAPAPVMTAPEAPRQTDLGLAPTAERPVPNRPQDDLLDIPAFLRRQAN